VTGLVPRHGKPELAELFWFLKKPREPHVQRHGFLLHVDRGTENISDCHPLRTAMQIGFLHHRFFLAEVSEMTN
jgi:hypothetical protein